MSDLTAVIAARIPTLRSERLADALRVVLALHEHVGGRCCLCGGSAQAAKACVTIEGVANVLGVEVLDRE